MLRGLPLLALMISLPLAAETPDVFGFVQKSCAGCHNSAVKSGDLDLKGLLAANTCAENRDVWEKVVEKLSTGQMPPQGTPQPPADAVTAVTGWLEAEF